MGFEFALLHYSYDTNGENGCFGGLLGPIGNIFALIWEIFQDFLWNPFETIWAIIVYTIEFLFTYPAVRWFSVISSIYLFWRFTVWLRNDLEDYYRLGTGGTPSNLLGWWRIKRLEFFGKVDVLSPPRPPPFLEPYRGFLSNHTIPDRIGERPIVKGCDPQRQVTQRRSEGNFEKVLAILRCIARENPQYLEVKNSFLEGYTLALFAKPGTEKLEQDKLRDLKAQFGYEIGHPHRVDGSLHLALHPEDVAIVIQAGWGERHPISGTYWYWLLYFNYIRAAFDFLREKKSRPPVPETLVFIYAPRDDEERKILKKLVQAAAWWITGGVDCRTGSERVVAFE